MRKLLYFEPDIEIVGIAVSGEEAIQCATELQPDIVLMDLVLPNRWTILSDGLIRLGLHQSPKLAKPMITCFAPDMPDRLAQLRQRGLKFAAEQKGKQGRRVGQVIESPDGQSFFLMTGEMKPGFGRRD